jgi:hypothetical protein
MTNQPLQPLHANSRQSQAEADLFQAIVHPQVHSQSPYPWDPSAPGADAYFDQGEAILEAIVDPTIFSLPTPNLRQIQVMQLKHQLQHQFATLPETILGQILDQGECLTQESLSRAEQLVHCIQAAFPRWSLEDLQVLARPYAYAMRSGTTPQTVASGNWESLSEVEQIKVGLGVAQMVLANLNSAE